MSTVYGGLSMVQTSSEILEDYLKTVKPLLEKECNVTFDTFELHSFKTQVVAGVNYFIKIHVGNNKYAHLRIYKSLPYLNEDPSIVAWKLNMNEDDELVHFN